MKKIFFVAFLFVSATALGQIFDPNNYGIEIKKADEAGNVSVQIPNGMVQNIKAIINPSLSSRGRLTGNGFILDVPIVAQTEWSQQTGSQIVSGFYYNEAAGFTAYKATAYYVEMYIGSDNKYHYNVLQAIGDWENTPNPASWANWYVNQILPITKYFRQVRITKMVLTENTQKFIVGL